MKNVKSLMLSLLAIAVACQTKPNREPVNEPITNLTVRAEKVAQIGEHEVYKYTLDNGMMQVEMSNYGGLISRILVPDRDGKVENIALTLDSIPQYFKGEDPFLGATAGRVANRISKAQFSLDGKTYQLAKTNGNNHLHGGVEGFNRKVWTGEPYSNDTVAGVKMHYLSPDMEEGYPGSLDNTLWMELTRDNVLRIRFESTTDKPTIVNLTNHTYFNLSGIKQDVLDHEVQFWADAFTPVNQELIPTGEVKAVDGTPFDFRQPRILGEQIGANGGGFDHNMVMKREKSDEMKHFARVRQAGSGRTLDMYSDAVGVQFYTGNFLNGFPGAEGKVYDKHWGFCLESQLWPDAINQPGFPSPVLKPGETYRHTIEYRFGVE